jgi:hypothetical protein
MPQRGALGPSPFFCANMRALLEAPQCPPIGDFEDVRWDGSTGDNLSKPDYRQLFFYSP